MPIGLSSDGSPMGDDLYSNGGPNRIVLCFDGTGNMFAGNSSDTNIVKLLEMFDHTSPRQKHYYQPGIGTYTSDTSVNRGFFARTRASISQTIDAGLATSFDQHVMAGYRFLMRYYNQGDLIYVFGFSRGAFTARYTSKMVADLGLLSAGNEEMVPFAYKVYQDAYLEGEPEKNKPLKPAREYLETFRATFCTHNVDKAGVKVHFLGLFDTVSSVGTFDAPGTGRKKLPSVNGTASHVRHAVAIDERRVKFKADLLLEGKAPKPSSAASVDTEAPETIKEVWFPGNHCDIGGGYPPEKEVIKDGNKNAFQKFWARLTRVFRKSQPPHKANVDKKNDYFQLSDITLKWMLDELSAIPNTLSFNDEKRADFLERYGESREHAVKGLMHDTMRYSRGSGAGMVMMWKMMEWLPMIRRWEYHTTTRKEWERTGVEGNWKYQAFPPNGGGTRDIPHGSRFHASVLERFFVFSDPSVKKPEKEKASAWQPRNDIYVEETRFALHDAGNHFNRVADAEGVHHPSHLPKDKAKGASDKRPNFVLHDGDEENFPHDCIYRVEYGPPGDHRRKSTQGHNGQNGQGGEASNSK